MLDAHGYGRNPICRHDNGESEIAKLFECVDGGEWGSMDVNLHLVTLLAEADYIHKAVHPRCELNTVPGLIHTLNSPRQRQRVEELSWGEEMIAARSVINSDEESPDIADRVLFGYRSHRAAIKCPLVVIDRIVFGTARDCMTDRPELLILDQRVDGPAFVISQ